MESLKIVMVSTFFPPYHVGGGGTHVLHLSNELAKLGHEIHVIYNLDAFFLPHLRRKEVYHEPDLENNVIVHPLKTKIGALDPVLNFVFGRSMINSRFNAVINKLDPDVIHYHNISLLGPLSLRHSKNHFSLYTAHDYWFICPKSDLFNNALHICSERKCSTCLLLSKRPIQLWRHFIDLRKEMGEIDRIIAPSRFMKKKLIEAGFKNVVVIPNFVPECQIKKRINKQNFFLFVGTLKTAKGIMELVKQFSKINTNSKLLIAGHGILEGKIRDFLRSNRLDNKIQLIGFVSGNRLLELYRSAKATIIPSLCYESFGLVAIESLSCGTPIILNNTEGLREIAEKSKAAKIIDIQRKGELEKTVKYFESKSELDFRKEAIKTHRLFFSPRSYIKKYMNLVKSLIG